MSDTFANGFWYMNALGQLAQYDHKVFLRQTLVGGFDGLLKDKYWSDVDGVVPNVDFFNAVLFKRYMGNNVFATSSGDRELKVYAHCMRGDAPGAVAVLLINFKPTEAVVELEGFVGKRVDFFLNASTPFSAAASSTENRYPM